VAGKGIVELQPRGIVPEPLVGTDMIAEFTAEVVIKASMRESG